MDIFYKLSISLENRKHSDIIVIGTTKKVHRSIGLTTPKKLLTTTVSVT